MLNKILAILLVGVTTVHGGWRSKEWEKRNPGPDRIDESVVTEDTMDRWAQDQKAFKRDVLRECKAAQNLPVGQSFMKMVKSTSLGLGV